MTKTPTASWQNLWKGIIYGERGKVRKTTHKKLKKIVNEQSNKGEVK